MKSSPSKNRVTIHIKKSEDKEGRWISLSRFQFEALIVLVPASFLFGVVAIGILIFDSVQSPAPLAASRDARQAAILKWHSESEDIQAVDSKPVSSEKESLSGIEPTPVALGDSSAVSAKSAALSSNDTVPKETPSKAQPEGEKTRESMIPVSDLGSSDENQKEVVSSERKSAGDSVVEVPQSLTNAKEQITESSSGTKSIEPAKKQSPAVFSVTQNIKMDELYSVSTTIIQREGSGLVTARIGMKNLTGLTESGRVWAKVLVSSGQEEQWLSSHVNLEANESLAVKEATFGNKYLFNSWVERELTFGKPRFKVIEVKEIILGAETEKHGQKVAKVDLRGSSDNQSGM